MGWKWIKASPGDLPCVWEMSLDEQMGGGGACGGAMRAWVGSGF